MSQSGRLSKDQIFAKLALQQKLASIDQINACINQQRTMRADGRRLRLSEVMVAEGIIPHEKAVELDGIDLEPLSCPRCELRYYYPDFDAEQTYTCPKCTGVLVVERERRITGQVKRPASMAAKVTDTPSTSSGTFPPQSGMDSGVMPLLDVNSMSTDSQVVLPAVGGPRGSDDAIEIVLPELKEDALCGTTIGGYRILKKLGQGGMGVIYKAEQVSLKRVVALKMLAQRLAADANYAQRFVHEARAVAKVNHANIVQIYDVGQDGKYCYFSMEYVEGENVGGILDRLGKIPPKLALDITIQVAQALSAAHANGIVHRDIKPDNIILSKDGTAKLADLGIAKTEDLTEQFQGGSGMQIGTPYYISPEQSSDPSGVDIRADIYSLGASYFHMVTGQFPYTGATPMMILMKLANDPTPKAHEVDSQVSYPVSRIIQKMMAKNRNDRYADPAELVAALEELKLEMSESGKSQRRKASLALLPREQMRIEPTHSATGELTLADDVKTAGARAKTQTKLELDLASAPKRPPPPTRATTNSVARPPALVAKSASTSAGTQRLAIQIAVVAVVLVVLAIAANAIFSSPGRNPDPTPEPPREGPGPKVGPSIPIATKSEAEIAWDALAKLYPLAELSDQELADLPRRLESFAARSDAGTMAKEALARRAEVDLELANRDWRAVQRELEPLLRGTADAKDFGKAETVLQAAIERLPKGHLKIGDAQKKLEDIRAQSRARSDELLLLASRRVEAEWPQALADLSQAAPRLVLACRDRLALEIAKIEQRIATAALKRRFEAREQLWLAAAPDLAQQSYDAGLDKAKERAKTLAPEIDVEAELAEIAALGQMWQAMRAKLDTSKGPLPLQFYDEAAPTRQVLTGLSSRGELMLESGLRPLIELHGDEVVRLADAAIRPAGVAGRMRAALLILSFGQLDQAVERLNRESADPAHATYRLRALCWHSGQLGEIDKSGPRTPQHYVPLAIHLNQIETHFRSCPEHALLEPLVGKWTTWIANQSKLPDELVDQAGMMRRAKKRLAWPHAARAVIAICPGTPAAKRAEDLLKKAD